MKANKDAEQNVPTETTPKPVVPVVPLELWRELYRAAADFQTLAPWEWMYDSYMLGIEVPTQIRVLSVLGARREVFALISYRGQRGITGLLNIRLGLWEPDAAEHGPNQDALLADFVPREELEPEDLAVMKQLKYKARAGKPHLYPQFRSHLPGYAPWFLDPAEAECLRHDLQKMAEFAQLLRCDPHLFDQRAMCEIPFYPSPAKGSPSVAQLQWRTLLPSPKPKLPPFVLDRNELEKLSALPQRQDFCWELDTFYTYDRIMANPRPYMARISLAMDAVSGQMLAVRAAALEVTLAQATGECWIEAMRRKSTRPGQVWVVAAELAEALNPMAAALGIALQVVGKLPQIHAAKLSWEQSR